MQIIFLIIFLGSIAGMLYLFWLKAPVIIEMPLKREIISKKKIAGVAKEKNPFSNFSIEKKLHKFLSSTRVLILKIENKISLWLQKLRKKKTDKEKKDDYWQRLKKEDNNLPE